MIANPSERLAEDFLTAKTILSERLADYLPFNFSLSIRKPFTICLFTAETLMPSSSAVSLYDIPSR